MVLRFSLKEVISPKVKTTSDIDVGRMGIPTQFICSLKHQIFDYCVTDKIEHGKH